MSIAFFNDQFLPENDIKISAMDRGFLFGDGVYEVIPFYQGKPFAKRAHFERLQQSLDLTFINSPLSYQQYQKLCQRLILDNQLSQGSIYLQITRGQQAIRNHHFDHKLKPNVMATVAPEKAKCQKIKVTLSEDNRWACNQIKSIALLGNVLSLNNAKDQGFDDCILTNNNQALEAPSSNLFMVKNGTLYTPPLSANILAGITRRTVLDLAYQQNIPTQETDILVDQLLAADEIWLTSSTQKIRLVTTLCDKSFEHDKIELLWPKMCQWYEQEIIQQCG